MVKVIVGVEGGEIIAQESHAPIAFGAAGRVDAKGLTEGKKIGKRKDGKTCMRGKEGSDHCARSILRASPAIVKEIGAFPIRECREVFL